MSPTESENSGRASIPPEMAAGPGVSGRLWRVLFVLLSVEIGVFLFLIPWSEVWDRNLVLSYYPSVRPFYLSHYLRGAVSGLGLVNLWLGVSQIWTARRLATKSPGRN